MNELEKRLDEWLHRNAPSARVARLREFFGDAPADVSVAQQLDLMEQRIRDNRRMGKWMEGLARLEHLKTRMQAEADRRAGADKRNEPTRWARDHAICQAKAIIENDTERELAKNDIIAVISADLAHHGHHPPNERVLWRWLSQAEILPDYVTRPGRRPKS